MTGFLGGNFYQENSILESAKQQQHHQQQPENTKKQALSLSSIERFYNLRLGLKNA